ncbi:MAG: hypothetical protein JWR86_3527 [Enterovirga sp.]|nr:hypothetical protein [Enterovirga sp.]
MRLLSPSTAARAALLASCAALTGCSSVPGVAEGGSTLANMFAYGSTTEPPLARTTVMEARDCPGVTVADGGAALRRGSSQISIANVARECIERDGGAIAVKVGVEGRALLGAGGAGGGRFDVPVSFAIKRGDQVLASRVRRVSVVIPSNDTQAAFMAVESDLIVPPGTGEFEIEVGLGGAAVASPRRRRG